jgi:hypothetical protein
LGSQLRHLPAGGQPGNFRIALVFHLVVAAVLAAHVFALAFHVSRTQRGDAWLVRPAATLLALVILEIGLGVSTWVTKYGWPSWLGDYGFAAGYTVVADSRQQAWTTTMHVAMGSMLLVNSLLVALRSARLAWHTASPRSAAEPVLLEAAR